MPRDWDAATYDRIADPMFRWGAVVAGRLDLAGDETVLDAGCGSGRVTEVLLERLPRGRVEALDGSPSMIEQALRRLRRSGAPDEARAFAHEVAARMPRLEIDYVRLNIQARRGGERRGRQPLR